MTAPPLDLSVIILTWQDAEFLHTCLASLQSGIKTLKYEVILIQNGGESWAQLAANAAKTFELRFIRNEFNRGVAAGRNQGLNLARGRYFLLLDADTRLTDTAGDTLVRFMDDHPSVGLTGPRLVDPEGRLQLTCRRLPTLGTKILRRLPLTFARARLAEETLANWDHASTREVDYVIGACQMIRREAFEQVGLLDERIFYGPEDVDYCIRMWQLGWRVVYVPHATVVHHERRLTQRRLYSQLSLYHAMGAIVYFWKYRYLWHRPKLGTCTHSFEMA
jgi:GT2 family glycosyltransferase